MSIDLELELTSHQTVRRNGNGQYLVLPPDAKKAVGYSRATTWAKVLDETENLKNWAMRTAVDGIRTRPELLDGDTPLRTLADQAFIAGGGHVRRDLGTAIHAAFERYARDGQLPLDPQLADDAVAIATAIDAAGFDIVTEFIEFMVVLDDYKIAGTCDLVLRRRSDSKLFIADLKTGSTVDYGGLSFAIQLAIYANADHVYSQGVADDGSDDVRLPMPDVRGDQAIIIHYDRDNGVTFHWSDIAAGWEALSVCKAVRDWRNKGRKMLTPFDGDGATTDTPGAEVVVGTVERTDSRPRRPTTNPHMFTAEAPGPGRIRTPKAKPTVTPITATTPTAPRTCPEGDPVDPAKIEKLRKDIRRDPVMAHSVRRWVKQGTDAGVAWNLGDRPDQWTERRYALAAAAIQLATYLANGCDSVAEMSDLDGVARNALALVIGDDAQQPVMDLGGLIGTLTIDQARELWRIAHDG